MPIILTVVDLLFLIHDTTPSEACHKMTHPSKMQGKTQHVASAAHDAMHQNTRRRRPADASSCTPFDLPKEVASQACATESTVLHSSCCKCMTYSYQGPLDELVRKKIRFPGNSVAGRLH